MLALVGSGEFLQPMDVVDLYLMRSLGEPARVVCLPTAAGTEGEHRIAYWSDLGVEHFKHLGADQVDAVPVIDRASADDPSLAERIRKANFVYLSGGKPDYLLRTLQNSRALEAILEVYQHGGVLAGCSAGAMVMGESIPGLLHWTDAFKLFPNALIIPHYDEMAGWLIGTVRLLARRNTTLYGIEGFTALLVNGKELRVIGRGNVTVWDGSGKAILKNPDLTSMQQAE
jgi:cyanophycinase